MAEHERPVPGEQTVQAEATFSVADVHRILEAAERGGRDVELVKDDGAYLLTWAADGEPVEPAYAQGFAPPERSQDPTADLMSPDSPWQQQRRRLEGTWGGDDFATTMPVSLLRDSLTKDGLRVRTTLRRIPWQPDWPAPLTAPREAVYELLSVDVLPST